MSVISKQLAKDIALKITQPSAKKVEDAKKEFMTMATEVYLKSIPQEVMDIFKKHYAYIETTSSKYFSMTGFARNTNVFFGKALPCKEGYSEFTPNKTAQEKLAPARQNWDKAVSEYAKLKEETENALMALKTFKNIREELPQAAKYLPPPISNALICNFSPLRKKLDQQKELTVS